MDNDLTLAGDLAEIIIFNTALNAEDLTSTGIYLADKYGLTTGYAVDADGDGVGDDADQCADTPAGEAVDADGCSDSQKDSDADGVSDADDQCAGTSAGETVDGNGCSDSQRDSDSDGVTDNADLCANTPAGATVDADGCDGFTLLAECETALEASEANCLACDDLEAIVIDVICTMFNIAPSTSKAEFDQETTALANAVLSAAVFCAPDDAASCLTQILDNL
jgi:hypothetical protein